LIVERALGNSRTAVVDHVKLQQLNNFFFFFFFFFIFFFFFFFFFRVLDLIRCLPYIYSSI